MRLETTRLLALLVSLFALACVPAPPSGSAEEGQFEDDDARLSAVASGGQEAELTAPGCSAERSCGRPTIVCKRPDAPRPCGAAGCVEMQLACSTSADCREGYSCKACAAGDPWPCGIIDGKCQPSPCVRDRDCGSQNLVCTSGACTHKPCRRSASCRGYCVAGSCWNEPGWCHDTTLPPPP